MDWRRCDALEYVGSFSSDLENDDKAGSSVVVRTPYDCEVRGGPRQLGALSSTLRIRNFEQNTLPLEIVFQDGRVMSPAEAKYPEVWRNLSIDEQRFALFLDQPTSITSTLDPRSP